MRQLNDTEVHVIRRIIRDLNWSFHDDWRFDRGFYLIRTHADRGGITFTVGVSTKVHKVKMRNVEGEYEEEMEGPAYTVCVDYEFLAVTEFEVYTLEDVAAIMAKVVAEVAADQIGRGDEIEAIYQGNYHL